MEERNSREKSPFLDALASKEPTPGGGSAAAFTGAQAAALVAMVGRLTVGKKKYVEVQAEMEKMINGAETLREELTSLIQEDAQAFSAVMDAFRLPKTSEEEKKNRSSAIQAATYSAALTPLNTCVKALEVMRLALLAASQGNVNAITDAGSASALAIAAISSAGANVRINLGSLTDSKKKKELATSLEKIENETQMLQNEIRKKIESRAGIALL